ncbi:MAG: DUF885 domain-containing protein [Gammaproteobacteria bacterium]|nr:DUF885 domain-containing protein [Gammaproteobacteria bacterium]
MRLGNFLASPVLVFVLMACAPTDTDRRPQAGAAFHNLLDEHWAAASAEKVFFRSDPDAWRMDGELSEHTPEARARRQQFNEAVLGKLADISVDELRPDDQLSYRIFKYEREAERESYQQPVHLFPITSQSGYHTYFAEAPSNMSFLAAADYDDYLVSLADFRRYNREYIDVLREAVRSGYTHYCGSISGYAATIEAHIVADAEQSLLYVPFTRFPGNVNDDQRAEYTRKGVELIESVIVPGYEELLDFFVTEYLPACRKEVGITSIPGSGDYYRYLIRYFTTTDMTAEEIHELGISELGRIRAEMQDIIDAVGFEGDFRSFVDFLREDPRFYARSDEELLGRVALISKTAEGELPRFFTLLPRATYKIVGNPERGAFYMPPSGDGTDSGSYFIKTGDLKGTPLYTIEALSLHEGVPGHHLQSALAQELNLPEFRRDLYHSAFGEGWGLYSERLCKEMGFYKDPYNDFGRLTYEAWRACRLIVDTGMHAFGWSRQQAVDFMLANTALSESKVNSEIDRYITWPAQALSYKIGELKIRELRARVEAALGSSFDIRRFHHVVIGSGSLPIAVLEQIVSDWIAAEVSRDE